MRRFVPVVARMEPRLEEVRLVKQFFEDGAKVCVVSVRARVERRYDGRGAGGGNC